MNCLFYLIILFDITSILIIEFWISDSHHHSFQPPSPHLVLLPSSFMWGSSLNPFYCLFILCSGMMPCLKTSHVQRCMVIHSCMSCMMSPGPFHSGPFHYGPPQLLHAWSRTQALPYRSTQFEWPYHAHYSWIGHTCTIIHLSCHSPISAFIIFYHHGVCD